MVNLRLRGQGGQGRVTDPKFTRAPDLSKTASISGTRHEIEKTGQDKKDE
jgi:hypothetical protein